MVAIPAKAGDNGTLKPQKKKNYAANIIA